MMQKTAHRRHLTIGAFVTMLGLIGAVIFPPPDMAAEDAPSGAQIIFSTYLGGSQTTNDFKLDHIQALKVDAAGNTYVAGDTNAIDFPVTPNAFQSRSGSTGVVAANAYDAFVAKFDAAGRLVYSSYLGGSKYDSATGIAVDEAGNFYVSGVTGSINFPTTPGAFRSKGPCQEDVGCWFDTFVAKFDSAGTLVYSTLLGTQQGHQESGIAVDAAGNAYVTGNSEPGMPVVKGLETPWDNFNVFVAKLNPTGSALLFSTYLGLGDGKSIAVDAAGNAYLAGVSWAERFFLKNAYWTPQPSPFGRQDFMFVAKVDTTKSGADALAYSTMLPTLGGTGIALGASGAVYVAGGCRPAMIPKAIILKDTYWSYYQSQLSDPYDNLAFVMKLDPSKQGDSSLVYCTFYSAAGAWDIAVDGEENVYLAGSTMMSGGVGGIPTANASFGGGGFLRSSDDGQTFESLDKGMTISHLKYIVLDPKDPAIIYAGAPGELMKSTDGGLHWGAVFSWHKDPEQPAYIANVLAIDPQTTSTMYTGIYSQAFDEDAPFANVYKSTDTGQTWKGMGISNRYMNVRALVIDPSNTAVLYAGVRMDLGNSPIPKVAGVFKSTDGGTSWTAMSNGLENIDVNALALDPVNPNTIYAGTRSGLYKSVNGGNSWNFAGPSAQVISITVDPKRPATVYASLTDQNFNPQSIGGRGNPRRRIQSDSLILPYQGLIKSTNSGQTWKEINEGFGDFLPDVHDLKVSPQDSSMLYAASSIGIYTSSDGGGSWSYNARLRNPVNALAVHPRAQSVFYAATAAYVQAHVTKLSADGSKIMYASYLGGGASDWAYHVAADPAGNLYVAGATVSRHFPTVNAFQTEPRGSLSSFITKIGGLSGLPEAKEPGPVLDGPPAPKISGVSISGKKLIIQGQHFSQGAMIMVNDAEHQTANDGEAPATRLVSKKGAKKIGPGQEVTLRVKNADGKLSDSYRFVRQP